MDPLLPNLEQAVEKLEAVSSKLERYTENIQEALQTNPTPGHSHTDVPFIGPQTTVRLQK